MLAWRPDIRPEMLWKAVIYLERPEGFEPPTRCFEDRSSLRPTMATHVHEGVFQSLRKRQPILWTPMVVDLCPPPWLQFGYSPGGYLCGSKEGIKLPEKSPAGVDIPGLAFSGRAERALRGLALEETGVESSNTRCAGAH